MALFPEATLDGKTEMSDQEENVKLIQVVLLWVTTCPAKNPLGELLRKSNLGPHCSQRHCSLNMGGLFHDYFNNFLFFESHIHIFINLLKIPLKIPHAEIFFILYFF